MPGTSACDSGRNSGPLQPRHDGPYQWARSVTRSYKGHVLDLRTDDCLRIPERNTLPRRVLWLWHGYDSRVWQGSALLRIGNGPVPTSRRENRVGSGTHRHSNQLYCRAGITPSLPKTEFE